MSDALPGELVTETFEYDGGRQVTVYVPRDPPQLIVFAGDGQRISKWGRLLERPDVPATMIVGVHGLTDETLRLQEYSPGFAPERFAAHEKFFVEDIHRWTESRFGVVLSSARTAVFGVSAGESWLSRLAFDILTSSERSSVPRLAVGLSRRRLCRVHFHAPILSRGRRNRSFSRTPRGGRARFATQVRMSS
jgi:hypothetical protein